MSGQIKLKAASLGGDITLTPTDTASNLVVTIPAGTSTLVTNDTLPTQLNASGSAPIYACRAWVNFNGTGTVAIRASGNVSSITDSGTGNYLINFTTAMSDTNYSVCGLCLGGTSSWYGIAGGKNTNTANTKTTTNVQLTIAYVTSFIGDAALFDHPDINVSIFR